MQTAAGHLNTLFFNPQRSVAVTNWLAVVLAALLIFLSWRLTSKAQDSSAVAINVLVTVIGALVGWALAMFWVPFDETEKSVFAQVGATVSAFVAGYAISKFDKLLEAVLYEGGQPVQATVIRIGLFLAAVLLAAVAVVTNRVSWLSSERERAEADPVVLQKAANVAAAKAAAAAAAAKAVASAAVPASSGAR